VQQGNFELDITPASNASGPHHAGYKSASFYDLTDSRVFVAVPMATNTATWAATYLTVWLPTGGGFGITESGGNLYAWSPTQNINMVKYDALAHRFWQLREQGPTLYFEASPDGSNWTEFAEASSLPPLGLVQVELSAGTNGAIASPGSAAFAVLNGGQPPTGSWCPISTLTDDFNDGARGPIWANSKLPSGCGAIEVSGEVQLTPPSNAVAQCEYVSAAQYDLTSGALVLEVLGAANQQAAAGVQVSLGLTDGPAGQDSVGLQVTGGTLYVGSSATGAIYNTPYSPSSHQWWRVREQAGNLYFDTSPDAKTWSPLTNFAEPFQPNAVTVAFGLAATKAVPSPGTARFANLNLLPP
jgi:hypothetical protein